MSDTTVSYGHAAAFFLLTFGIGLLPPVGVSVMGMKVLGVFVGTLVLGWILLNMLPFGYVESAVLFLAAVVAASAAWIGREK